MEQNYVNAGSFQSAPSHAILGKRYEAEYRAKGKTGGGFAVLDKDKIYFGGECFVKENRSFERKPVNWCASVGEVLACSYLKNRRPACLIIAIVSFVLAIVFFSFFQTFRLIGGKDIAILLAYGVIASAGIFALGIVKLIQFINSTTHSYFEIRLDGVSYCYPVESLELQEGPMFRAALNRARAEYMQLRGTFPYVRQSAPYAGQSAPNTEQSAPNAGQSTPNSGKL